MKQINEYTTDELSAKIEAIKAEREKMASALKKYEEELERRKQEVPLGVPAEGNYRLCYDGKVTAFLSEAKKLEVYAFNCFSSKESAEKHAEMLLAWREALVANSKGEPIDIEVLLPLLKKGWVFYQGNINAWQWSDNKPTATNIHWEYEGESYPIYGFNIKPAEDWQNSLMECGL